MSGIRFNDRTLIVGATGSGKSELLNVHFSAFRCQRLLIDTKEEWAIAGVEPVATAAELDWREPVLHFRGELGGRDEIDDVFRRAYQRRGLVVCVHELADLCDFEPQRTPRHVAAYLSKGRAHGLGLLGASQRPVEMPKRARTECDHVFVFPRVDPDDRQVVARTLHRSTAQLDELLERVRGHGEHAFAWYDRTAHELVVCPPLPPELRRRGILRSRSFA